MGTVRKTITLTDQQGEWVKARIARGDFTNDSEYIRDLIRRDQERDAEIEAVRVALIEGENSGISKRKPGDIVRAAKKKLNTDGRIWADGPRRTGHRGHLHPRNTSAPRTADSHTR